MLVKINRGPRFGESLHVPASQEIQLAILLGDIVPVEEPKPAPVPAWSIGQRINETYYVQFNHQLFGSTCFDGAPEGLDGFEKALPGRVQIPAELRERYTALYKSRKGSEQ